MKNNYTLLLAMIISFCTNYAIVAGPSVCNQDEIQAWVNAGFKESDSQFLNFCMFNKRMNEGQWDMRYTSEEKRDHPIVYKFMRDNNVITAENGQQEQEKQDAITLKKAMANSFNILKQAVAAQKAADDIALTKALNEQKVANDAILKQALITQKNTDAEIVKSIAKQQQGK